MITSPKMNIGFSQIELLIVLTIIAIISGFTAPDLSTLLRKTEIKTTAKLLRDSLKLARNHAVVTGVKVHLCATKSNKTKECSEDRNYNANWSAGWTVFADNNHNNTLDEPDNIIQLVHNETPTKIVFNQRGRLRFFPSGRARSAGFYLCDREGLQQIHIRLLHSGRNRSHDQLTEKQKSVCTQTENNNIL